ncbi:hypothetical protein [Lysinibacillus yapensis]|uniref:hypothetical protein n=1 Tax=Ureibacillus yapensis TaxID=2304605 RepID=UPI001314E16F|nr:hypothetical protein [Lysinibacillus yapensis]
MEESTYYEFEPIHMQTDILYGESYAILDECTSWDFDTTFHYEVLYVAAEGIILKKFYRKKLDNVEILESHPLFQSSIWIIEETTSEIINAEDIIKVVAQDIYASKVPTNNGTYQYLVKRSKLFEQFFEDLYEEMNGYYSEDQSRAQEKWKFGEFLQSEYAVEFEHSEGTDIILSSCLGMMRKLNLTDQEMAEYFLKYNM